MGFFLINKLLLFLPLGVTLNQRDIATTTSSFVGLAYQGKDIVFSFIIEYTSLMDFCPLVVVVVVVDLFFI
jgi:hypothetical protein